MKIFLISLIALVSIASADRTGAEIFKKCAICHGDKAQKKSLGLSKIIANMKADKILEELKAYRAGELNQYGQGAMMKGQATKLTDDEMQTVALYVESLPNVEEEKEVKVVKKIPKDTLNYNQFLRYFFAHSTNPNETFAAAKQAWDKRQADIKAGITVEEIHIKKIENAEKIKDKRSHGIIDSEEAQKEIAPIKKSVEKPTQPKIIEPKPEEPKEEESSFWSF